MFNAPQPRTEYGVHIAQSKNVCVFCSKEGELLLAKYDHFVWKYAAFPYQKFHTLVLPKRHVEKISELNTEEMIELQGIIDVIGKIYQESGVVSDDSAFGNQLLFTWRIRNLTECENKKVVAHFHIHIYPRREAGNDITLDNDAHIFDTDILKKFV